MELHAERVTDTSPLTDSVLVPHESVLSAVVLRTFIGSNVTNSSAIFHPTGTETPTFSRPFTISTTIETSSDKRRILAVYRTVAITLADVHSQRKSFLWNHHNSPHKTLPKRSQSTRLTDQEIFDVTTFKIASSFSHRAAA